MAATLETVVLDDDDDYDYDYGDVDIDRAIIERAGFELIPAHRRTLADDAMEASY